MDLNEFKDALFEVLNETDGIPIKDIDLDDRADSINITMDNNDVFTIICKYDAL